MKNKILAVYTEYHYTLTVVIGITIHVAIESSPGRFKAYHLKFVNHNYPSEFAITQTAESGHKHNNYNANAHFPLVALTHKLED